MRFGGRGLRGLVCLVSLWAVVAAVPLHGLSKGRALGQFGVQTWQSDSGLPQNTVRAVVQTRDGFLWIGTEAGLVRFDGVSFRVFDRENTPEMRSEIVNDLEEDGAGVLWISTAAGLVREAAGSFGVMTVAEGLPSNSVLRTFVPREGGLLAVTGAGLAVLRGDRFAKVAGTEGLQPIEGGGTVVEDVAGRISVAGNRGTFWLRAGGSEAQAMPVSADMGEVRALAVTDDGEVWVGGRGGVEGVTPEGAAYLPFSTTKIAPLRRITVREGLPGEEVEALQADGSGGMWIGTNRGLARWTLAGGVARVDGLSGVPVTRIFRDREGTVWVATSRGIARVVDGRAELMTRGSRLAGVLRIFEDREGSVWFGTDNAGLTVMREQAFSTVSEGDGLTAGLVRAVFQDSAGTVWIGTNGGGLDRIEAGGKVSGLVSRPGLSSDVVLSLAQTGGDLWVGTPDGLNRVRGGQVRVFTTADGLADDFVRSLYADRDGTLWIGTRNGLTHMSGERFTSYSRMDGLGSDLIGAMVRSRAGEFWVGTLGGLSRWTGSSFANLTTKHGLGSDAVTALLEDGAGTLWVGTQDAGLSRVRGGTVTALEAGKTGLPGTVFGMLEDGGGNLWLSSRRGVDRVSLGDLNAFAESGKGAIAGRAYGVADGMRIGEGSSGGHPAAWRMRDGSLWFATLDGAAYVAPESVAVNRVAPLTAIERVVVNDRPVAAARLEGGEELRIQPGERRMEVAYAGLSFVAPGKVRYRYRLRGFDKGWVEAGARREAFYTNVPPGRYRFEVVSANNDGVWGTEPAGFAVRVEPTLLQTRWFYAVLAALVAGLVWAGYRWRVHTVEAQYRAVLGERGRIAREIHDTLAQGYVAISVQLELAERLLRSSKEAAALKQLGETKELVRGSLAEARSSIWNLRSQNEAGTLPSQLAALTEGRASAEGPVLKLEVKGTYRAVSAGVEKEILRVAQEAVANAVRHAGAKQVRVVLRYDASVLELEVMDDGSGFANAAEDRSGGGHFGLKGMRERAARIGGVLAVESRPGEGTVVRLRVDGRRAERGERL